ncbi:MAG: hypothetical protein IJT15_00730 [Rickettsiales bacterium]|nr:hypothetical protein [Rickettsiales bacterium]
MKENNINKANVNYNIWRDKFLPEGQEPSDDYLPPEVETYCKVVDGISNENNLPIFVVPIYVPNNSVLLDNGDYTDGKSGIDQMLCDKSLINYEKNKERETLYQQVSKHILDLTNYQKPFGLLHVYHNNQVITHVEPYMHFFNQNDKHIMVSMTDLNEREADIIDKQIYGEKAKFISTRCNNNVKLIKDSYGRDVDNILINNGKEIYKNYFGCRILAIQFLLSCLKEKQALQGVFNIERVNDIMAIKNGRLEQAEESDLSDNNIPLIMPYFSRYILGDYFNKFHEVDIDTLADELCLHDKIREQYVNINNIIDYISSILRICDVFTASVKKNSDAYKRNIQLLTTVLNDFYKFAKDNEPLRQKLKLHNELQRKDVENLGGTHDQINDFLDEIKIRTRLILALFVEDKKIQSIMDNIFPKGDVKRWMKGDEYLPQHIKHGLYEKIVHELLKVIYDVKQIDIGNKKRTLEKENIFRKAKNGKLYNVGLAKLGAEWYAKYANKKFLKEHNDIIKKYSNGNVDSLAYTKYKQCEHIEAIDEVEKSYDITNKRLGETYNATGNRYWPFGLCSSCNGCDSISNKGIDEYQQTLGK